MKISIYIFSIIILLSSAACQTYDRIVDDKELIVEGKLIEKQTGEDIINAKLSEVNRISNYTYTDLEGKFKLKLQGNYPIVVYNEGYGEPRYFKLEFGKANEIKINTAELDPPKSSKRVYKKFLRSKKRDQNHFKKSINGNWLVKDTLLNKTPEWERSTSNYTRSSFRKVFGAYFLGGLKKDDTVTISSKKLWTINNNEKRKYYFKTSPVQFSFVHSRNKSRSKYDYWSIRYQRVNEDTLALFLYGNYSEYEWRLERQKD